MQNEFVSDNAALADLGVRTRRMPPPMGPNSFVFAYIFTKKHLYRRSTPPYGKSWIRHCVGLTSHNPFYCGPHNTNRLQTLCTGHQCKPFDFDPNPSKSIQNVCGWFHVTDSHSVPWTQSCLFGLLFYYHLQRLFSPNWFSSK